MNEQSADEGSINPKASEQCLSSLPVFIPDVISPLLLRSNTSKMKIHYVVRFSVLHGGTLLYSQLTQFSSLHPGPGEVEATPGDHP